MAPTSHRIFLISGQSGSGKTTLGCNLSLLYQDVVHFDGDIFYHGGDPVADAGTYNGVKKEESATEQEQAQKARARLVANYEDLFDGNKVPLERWIPVLEPFCQAVAKASTAHPTLVASLAVYQHQVRQWIQKRIKDIMGDQTKVFVSILQVVLHDSEGAAPKRKLGMIKSEAQKKGLTIEEFLATYNQPYEGEEKLLQRMSRNQTGFEPGSQDEIAITLSEGMDQNVVAGLVGEHLKLSKKE